MSATVSLGGSAACGSQATIQEGTQGVLVTTADFGAFAGNRFNRIVWQVSGGGGSNLNVFTLNDAGRAYLQSVFGGGAKFCVREYEHDCLDVAPGINSGYDLGMYFEEHGDSALRPKMTITYK